VKFDSTTLLLLGGAAVAIYLASQAQAATPLSIYPELAYTAQTSMAKTPAQQASTVVPSTSLYTATQGQELSALYAQCAGSWPSCTTVLGDTQLGF
jgi:hypothetical protein